MAAAPAARTLSPVARLVSNWASRKLCDTYLRLRLLLRDKLLQLRGDLRFFALFTAHRLV